jgi:aconitate hydratase
VVKRLSRQVDVGKRKCQDGLEGSGRPGLRATTTQQRRKTAGRGRDYRIHDGSVVIAAITSCTNTSNPYVMIAAGLVARKARALGLRRKPWVKTSLAPGSQVVSSISRPRGCRRISTRLASTSWATAAPPASATPGRCPSDLQGHRQDGDLVADLGAVGQPQLRGPREPRRARELPRLAAAGRRLCDRRRHEHRHDDRAARHDKDGKPVYLKDIWPTRTRRSPNWSSDGDARGLPQEVRRRVQGRRRAGAGGDHREPDLRLAVRPRPMCRTRPTSRACPPSRARSRISEGARILALLGDIDHHRPHLAGRLVPRAPARGQAICRSGRCRRDFNSYGARRGNHEVMMRGTFANIRIRNEMLDGVEGGYTLARDGEQMAIYDAAMAVAGTGRAARRDRRQGVRHRVSRATGRPRARRCSASRR